MRDFGDCCQERLPDNSNKIRVTRSNEVRACAFFKTFVQELDPGTPRRICDLRRDDNKGTVIEKFNR